MGQPLYEFGGDGPVMLLALANGFPPQSYAPLLRPFTESYRVVCLPPRAMWPEYHDPQQLRSWRDVADDLLAGMRAYDLTDVVAIGHSMGGVAIALAAIEEPGRFGALALLDPVFLPPKITRRIRLLRLLRLHGRFAVRNKLLQGALRRRRNFESAEEAYTYFKGKRLFADWPEETVRLYSKGAVRPSANGSGLELAWRAEWEARYYLHVFGDTWQEVPKLRDSPRPILALRGTQSDTFMPVAVEKLRRELPSVSYAEVEGGHLFPQSAPEATYQALAAWLQTANL